ncbi:MAG: carboxypeptidase regulatory-like domain-containing protein [Verrucomicrobiales bacterium]|nr:carboxypeptidase regulatory-like domain-containing protein [Verrucomicrobiales bacterium]
MNSNLLARANQQWPRLRVVLPLLAVCCAVIFFSIQDRLREQAQNERETGRQYSSGAEFTPRTQTALRQIPQRRLTPGPEFPRADRLSDERAPLENLSLEGAEAEPDVAQGDSPLSTIRAVPRSAIIGPHTSGSIISGHITLNGVPPPERDVPFDPSCARLRADKVTTRFFVVDERGGLGDVVVALEPTPTAPPLITAVPAQAVLLDQIGCEFVPYVLAVQAGQELQVRNSDPVFHNVHLMPNVFGNKELNRAHPAGTPDLELALETPELFLRIKCDVHPWMFAYVSVFDHGYFAVTQPDGSFQINNVPPGDYLIMVAHRRLPKVTKPITVQYGEVNTMDFVLDIASLPPP